MSLRELVKRLLCPSCIQTDSSHARRAHTVHVLERSGEALDRIAEELHWRAIQQRMAEGSNPLLGERPERDVR